MTTFRFATYSRNGTRCCASNDLARFHQCQACKGSDIVETATRQPTTAAARPSVTATPRRPVVRVTAPVEDFSPPNIYEKPLAELRGDTITPTEIAAIARRADPRGPDDFRPPNPYDAPLALRKIQENRS